MKKSTIFVLILILISLVSQSFIFRVESITQHEPSSGTTYGIITTIDPVELTSGYDYYASAISQDNQYVAVVGTGTNVEIFYTYNGSSVTTLTQPISIIQDVDFSYDNQYLVVGDRENKIHLWDVGTWSYIGNFSGNSTDSIIRTVKFSHDNQYLAYGESKYNSPSGNRVHIMSVGTWTYIGNLSFISEVYDVDFSADSNYIAIVGNEFPLSGHVVYIYNVGSWSLATSFDPSGVGTLYTCSFSEDNQYLAVAGTSGTTRVWVYWQGNWTFKMNIEDPTTYVWDIDYSYDNETIAWGGGNKRIFFHNSSTGVLKWYTSLSSYTIYGLDFSQNQRWIASGSASRGFLYNVSNNSFQVTRTVSTNTEINNFTFTPSFDFCGDLNVTYKIPVSTSVKGIVNVQNNSGGPEATEVNGTDELVNNSFYFDANNYFVYIRTDNITTSTTINWTINCSYGATFNIVSPRYLEVGDYFFSSGLIQDSSGNAISGFIATTRILYQNGSQALTVNHKWNCTNGNYWCVLSTTQLTPGIYTVSIEFTDTESGIIFKEGNTLYLSTSPSSDIHVWTSLHFSFYNSNTGLGLNNEMFKVYASPDITINEDNRILVDYYGVYTGQTIHYRIDDFFDNQIYPSSYDYANITITSTNQYVNIPIDWYSFSVKNMNHSIVYFEMTNGSRTYDQYLFPYEPFYWDVLSGNYTINLTYHDPVTDVIVDYLNTTIEITSDSYYWIRGYDLQDIIIEIQVTNGSLNNISLNILTDIGIVNSTINAITLNIVTNLSATESNITSLINLFWANFNLSKVIIGFMNNTMWSNFTNINITVNTINNKLTIDFDFLNSSVAHLNNTIFNVISLTETNLTNLNNYIWNSVNLTKLVATYINNTIWGNFTTINITVDEINNKLNINFNLLNLTVDYLNNTIWANFAIIQSDIGNVTINVRNQLELTENNLTALYNNILNIIDLSNTTLNYINNTIWAELNALNISVGNISVNVTVDYDIINSSIDTVKTTIISMWTQQNSTIGNLANRSIVIFNFYNTNEGLGLDRETLKIYINGSRLISNIYYCNLSDVLNLTVRDYYDNILYQNNITVNATYMYVDLGLTFHSWLFGNKNDDYWFVSLLKQNASRWWERAVTPYESVEFLIPSGTYRMRIYNATYYEIHNASYIINNSRAYLIHGTNLSLIASGLSVIRGQLLEMRAELDYALMPDAEIYLMNPPIIFSCFDRIGMMLGQSVWKVCPALNVIAQTRNETHGNWINSTPLIPSNGTVANGTITVVEDIIYFSGSATWLNITYTNNGTEIQNTSYLPSKFYPNGYNVTINASTDITILRETRYNQLKKFYWDIYNSTINPGYISGKAGYHTAGIEIINPLTVPIYDVYVFAGFSEVTKPDPTTVRVTDVDNGGIILEEGEQYKAGGSGIEFKIPTCINASSTRNFKLEYYKDFADSYEYSEKTIRIDSHETGKSQAGKIYNYFKYTFINTNPKTFRGSLYFQFTFDIPTEINPQTIIVYDASSDVNITDFSLSDSSLKITHDGLGDIPAGGGKTIEVYFQFKTYPGVNPEEVKLNTPIFNFLGLIDVSPFMILFLIGIAMIVIGILVYFLKDKKDWASALIAIGILVCFILFILQAQGL